MSRVLLTTESGADIPPELAARHHIHTVPMHVSFGGESREDGTFPSDEICGYYRRTGVLPRTSGSTPEDFSRVFDRLHAQYPEGQILHLAYSAVTTCSFQSARLAAEGRDYVTIVDTKMASAGQGAVVLRTARLLEEHPEWDAARTAAAAEELSRRCRMCFIPGSLEFPRAGGRVSNATALCGRLLSIHPLIELQDGYLRATRKLRGSMERLVPRLVRDYLEEHGLERDELWLIWAPGLDEALRQSAEGTARACGVRQLHWVKTGGVITTHGGPRAFGVVGFAAGPAVS